MMSEDTIGAIASGVGGAVSVIRISGPDAERLCSPLWRSVSGHRVPELPPRMLTLGAFGNDGECIDPSCLAVRMPGPNSFTGENVVEFHCHGGALCTRSVLAAVLKAGVRLAEPGEFSKRAFLNGKIDLVQAEAIADMISAGSDAALKIAGNQLRGMLGSQLRQQQNELQELLAEVESRLDFPEEQLDWIPEEEMRSRLETLLEQVRRLAETRACGEVLRDGVSLVIAGPPNAGKSTLLNRMLGRERAIVSEIPGTTRDTIEAMVQIHGIPFRLVDTAGIRDDASDAIENAGMERTRDSVESAQLVLWLMDGTRPLEEQAMPADWKLSGTLLQVVNKADLEGGAGASSKGMQGQGGSAIMLISALTGAGIEELYSAMTEAVLSGDAENTEIAVASRHAELLQRSAAEISSALPALESGEWELLAYHLREALRELRGITGEVVSFDVLDTIFSRFCIGK